MHLRNDQLFCSMRCRDLGSVERCEIYQEAQEKVEASPGSVIRERTKHASPRGMEGHYNDDGNIKGARLLGHQAIGGLLQGVVVIYRKVADAILHRVMSAELCHDDVHGSDCNTMQRDFLESGSSSTLLIYSSEVKRDDSSGHCSWSDCSFQHQDSWAAAAVSQPLWRSKQRESSIVFFLPDEICVSTEVGEVSLEDMLVNLQY